MERSNGFLYLVSFDDLTWIPVIWPTSASLHPDDFCDGTGSGHRNCAIGISNQWLSFEVGDFGPLRSILRQTECFEWSVQWTVMLYAKLYAVCQTHRSSRTDIDLNKCPICYKTHFCVNTFSCLWTCNWSTRFVYFYIIGTHLKKQKHLNRSTKIVQWVSFEVCIGRCKDKRAIKWSGYLLGLRYENLRGIV